MHKRPLLKTNNRDLTFNRPENHKLLQITIESEARKAPPVHILTQKDGVSPFGDHYYSIPGTDLSGCVNFDRSVSWGKKTYLGRLESPEDGWASLHAEVHNISLIDSINELAIKYRISTETPIENPAYGHSFITDKSRWSLPNGNISIDGVEATFMDVIPISFPRQGAQYLLAVFQSPCGKVLHLPAIQTDEYDVYQTQTPPEFSWGFSPDDIPLSELDVLELHLSAAVLLTDDAWLAHQINRNLEFLDQEHHEHLVAVAIWAGTSRIANYNYAPLQGREITYVPTLHRDSITAGIELRGELNSIGIEDFNILMTPFAANTSSIDDSRCECGNYACDNAVEFSRRNVLMMLDDVADAWPFDRYKRFCEQEGLIETKKHIVDKKSIPLFKPAEDIHDAAQGEEQNVSLSLECVFTPSNITVIVGDSDAGKTMFTRTIALGITTATETFGMSASQARNVYSINAEQDFHKSDIYTTRSMAALGIKETPARFYDYPELSMPTPEGLGPLDVLNADWQDYIFEEVAPGSVLIIDNLLAASGKELNHPSTAREIKKYAGRLLKKEVALIIIHHTGKDGKAMGSDALKGLAQNLIMVHQAETRNGFQGGVNALVTFEKFKGYPLYKGKQFRAHLEYTDTETEGTPWVFEGIDTTSEEVPATTQRKPDVAGLHKIQQAAIHHAFEHGHVTRSDLVDMGFKTESVKKHLAKLVEEKWLNLHKEGRSSYYIYRDPKQSS